MSTFKNLEPENLWQYFEVIASIPRPSKKEEKIISYLVQFAKKHSLEYKKDHIGNVLIKKQAFPSKENSPVVVLQSHVDMVCEKNSNVNHDFTKDPIVPFIKGDWLQARGTTLGADDGIGVAAMLAILSDPKLVHGPLECLFTVDEESGLTGAFELTPDFIQGKTLINLDSEDEGEIFIGCAGGKDTIATFKNETDTVAEEYQSYLLSVTGLQGGHSGDDIHRGLGNSLKIMSNFIYQAYTCYNAALNRFEGGNLKNAIPREAFATILVPIEMEEKFLIFYHSFFKDIKERFAAIEANLSYSIDPIPTPETRISNNLTNNLLVALNNCPHGVIEWSRDIEGLVQTSTNLASIKFLENKEIVISTSQRSQIETEKIELVNRISNIFINAGAQVKHSNGYPGWAPNLDSKLLKVTVSAYQQIFGVIPQVKAIHAGLECGLFLEKYPDLDMVSFGPTIKGAHSPDERLHIPSVKKFWKLLIKILEQNN